MAHLEAMRDAFGDRLDLRIDYNQALQPFGAISVLRDVERFQPTFIEQPVPRDCLSAMASFTEALDTPVLADESCFDARDLMEIVKLKAADAISVKLMKAGGILKAQAQMAIADTVRHAWLWRHVVGRRDCARGRHPVHCRDTRRVAGLRVLYASSRLDRRRTGGAHCQSKRSCDRPGRPRVSALMLARPRCVAIREFSSSDSEIEVVTAMRVSSADRARGKADV